MRESVRKSTLSPLSDTDTSTSDSISFRKKEGQELDQDFQDLASDVRTSINKLSITMKPSRKTHVPVMVTVNNLQVGKNRKKIK